MAKSSIPTIKNERSVSHGYTKPVTISHIFFLASNTDINTKDDYNTNMNTNTITNYNTNTNTITNTILNTNT